jgi:hypothetical protein
MGLEVSAPDQGPLRRFDRHRTARAVREVHEQRQLREQGAVPPQMLADGPVVVIQGLAAKAIEHALPLVIENEVRKREAIARRNRAPLDRIKIRQLLEERKRLFDVRPLISAAPRLRVRINEQLKALHRAASAAIIPCLSCVSLTTKEAPVTYLRKSHFWPKDSFGGLCVKTGPARLAPLTFKIGARNRRKHVNKYFKKNILERARTQYCVCL